MPHPLPAEAAELYRRIVARPTEERGLIVEDARRLARSSLAWTLRALFRQQARAGYVLFDPATEPPRQRCFDDPELGLSLRLQWNPQRELRKHHELLLERGVLARAVDAARLVNRNERGVGCYLCHGNIVLQNPGEVTLPLRLAGEDYYLGANFAPIADNHFTVMSAEHRPQRFHAGIVRAGLELVAATDGEFRALFNGRAGASIEAHEHLHATDLALPIEALRPTAAERLWENDHTRLSRPAYYLPLWLIEGDDIEAVVRLGENCTHAWHRLDPERHTENLIMTRAAGRYRLFILLRDRRRLSAPGLKSAMATFEAGGLIVLSEPVDADPGGARRVFETADLAQVRALLSALRPERDPPGLSDLGRAARATGSGFTC